MLPEFTFTQERYDLYTVRRSLYLGDSSRCCITGEDYYTLSGYYITCPPALKKPSTTRSCDLVLSQYCFGTPVNTSVCKTWLQGYIQARGYDQFTLLGYEYCKTQAQRDANKFCEVYLTLMRDNPDKTVHDAFLDSIRDTTFRCSYPLKKAQTLSKSTNLPRVCWDPNCINSPSWKLKYVDYIARQNCTVVYSNVTYTVSDPNTLNYVKVQSDATQLAEFRQVLENQNIYTKPLKEVGRGFLDIFPLVGLIAISILIVIE